MPPGPQLKSYECAFLHSLLDDPNPIPPRRVICFIDSSVLCYIHLRNLDLPVPHKKLKVLVVHDTVALSDRSEVTSVERG